MPGKGSPAALKDFVPLKPEYDEGKAARYHYAQLTRIPELLSQLITV